MRRGPLARALLVLAGTQWCACAQAHFTAAVFNYAQAPPTVIDGAIATARRAFLAAGIESRWVVCGAESCTQELPGGAYVEVFVMPKLARPLVGFPDERPAGYAMLHAFARPRAYAFYDAAKKIADRTVRPIDLALGCILIHECGHLLGLKHDRSGVMRPNLDGADLDNAVRGRAFNAGEVSALRSARNYPGGGAKVSEQ